MQTKIFKTNETEAEIQSQIIQILMLKKYVVVRINSGMRMIGKRVLRFYHIANNGSSSGFPDLIAIKNNKIVMVEVKTSTGKLRQSQEEFINLAEKHGNTILVASSWEEVLKHIEAIE